MAGAKWLRRCDVFLSQVASGSVRKREGRLLSVKLKSKTKNVVYS